MVVFGARLRVTGAGMVLSCALFAGTLLASSAVSAEEMESDAVYLPADGARALSVRNPLGTVRVQGWDRAEVRIVAHKRAGSPSVLERLRVRADFGDGRVRVTTGFYLSDQTFNSLPLPGAAIDLVIDAPRQVALAVATFRGDVDASGLRAGAQLSSQQGHIRVADIEGPVDTRARDGNQWFEAIRGSLAASSVDGDLDLSDIIGERIDVVSFRGNVTARSVEAQVVRLHTTVGTVLFIGALQPGASYDLATRDGDVRMRLPAATWFDLKAHAASLQSDFALAAVPATSSVWRRVVLARPERPQAPPARLDLASLRGTVELRDR